MTQLLKKSGFDDDPRRRQLIVGLSILGLLILVVPAFYIVWHFVPGLFGEWLGVVAGVISTPFLLEIFFVIVGLIIVVTLNQIRQKREGDEFVYIQQIDDHSTSLDLDSNSEIKSYQDQSLHRVEASSLDQIKGALEIGDHERAARLLTDMTDDNLKDPVVLALRIRLARDTGQSELATHLENESKLSAQK